MIREKKIKFAKLLLALSLVLILTGIGLHLDEEKSLNLTTKTHMIGELSQQDISITTTDDPIGEDITSNNNTSQTEEITPETKTPPVENINPTTKEAASDNSPPVTIQDTNNTLRNSLQNQYGITIRYGAETNGYMVAGLTTNHLTDPNRINEILNTLNVALSHYPSGIFTETKQAGYTLTIYLIKSYSQNNVTGITDSTTKNILISLATDFSFEESLYHEVYHYLEKYMYAKGANYTTWNSLNPPEFSYGKTNSNLSYTTANNPNSYFVNNYAQTDQYEDRASTFEYMMDDVEASCLTTGTPIWKKAKYICEQIDAVFQSVSPTVTEYWERFIYN